jgi:hypothetical protein
MRVKRKFFIFNAKTRFLPLARAFKHGVYIGSTGRVPIARIFIEWGLQSVQLGYRAVSGFRLTKDKNGIYPQAHDRNLSAAEGKNSDKKYDPGALCRDLH